MRKNQKGFTLIEIAIVLVIIGLLLGGVLKGQELIQNARVRNIIAQQDGIKAAFFGFQDRYRGIPGDYLATSAVANIPGAGAASCGGNGDSLIKDPVNGVAESICAWYHLSHAGFISGNYSGIGATSLATAANSSNSPTNPFGGVVQLNFDNDYADGTTASGSAPAVHNIKTGTNIPATVLAEIDRKIDDGLPTSGSFRFSDWQGSAPGTFGACVNSGVTPYTWAITSSATQCSGVSLF